MRSKPRNNDPPKPAKVAKWKARSAVLLSPGDVVPPKPTNGDAAPPAALTPGPKRKARRDP